MNRLELAKRIRDKRPNISHELSCEVVSTLLEHMSEKISAKGRIQIRGFGSFFVKTYKNWITRNPMNNKTLSKRLRLLIRFRVSPKILKSLNNIDK